MSVILSDQYTEGTKVRLLYYIMDGFDKGNVVIYLITIKRSSGEIWHRFINQNGDTCLLMDGEFEII